MVINKLCVCSFIFISFFLSISSFFVIITDVSRHKVWAGALICIILEAPVLETRELGELLNQSFHMKNIYLNGGILNVIYRSEKNSWKRMI